MREGRKGQNYWSWCGIIWESKTELIYSKNPHSHSHLQFDLRHHKLILHREEISTVLLKEDTGFLNYFRKACPHPINPIFSEKKIIQFKLWETRTLHSATSSHTLSLTSHLGVSEKTPSILPLFRQRKQKIITLGCVETKKTYILHTSIELVIFACYFAWHLHVILQLHKTEQLDSWEWN